MTTPSDAIQPPCTGCRRGVDRRTFLSATVLAAVAVALDACTNPLVDGGAFNGSYGGPITVTLANFSALSSVGGVARVDNGSGAPTALYRSGSTSFVALALVCTHAGYYPLDITANGFYCPLHGSSFAKSGGVTSGVAPASLQTFATTYSATSGTVTITRPA